MDSLLGWLKSFRRAERVTAAEIRRQLAALRQQHHETTTARDGLALDAVNDDGAALRWTHLDATVQALAQRLSVLDLALGQAEAKEADAAEQADAAAHAQQMQHYQRQTTEAQAWLDALLARLPSGEELTEARNIRRALVAEARSLSRRSSDVSVRRPLDPLDAMYAALAMRVQRIERARWIHGDHPITLIDETRPLERTGTHD